MNTWEIVGYVVLAALAIGILVNIRDTKRIHPHTYIPGAATRPGTTAFRSLHPVMMALRDLDDCDDAERVRKKIEPAWWRW
jgi:hypothetical protein